MKTPINIHALRDGTVNTDRAILDLLHLQQLGMAPGTAPVRLLEQLWGITQPQVSRRIAAVAELGLYRVETNNAGRYLLLPDQRISHQRWEVVTMPPPVEVDDSDRPSARERWEAVRQQLQEVVGCPSPPTSAGAMTARVLSVTGADDGWSAAPATAMPTHSIPMPLTAATAVSFVFQSRTHHDQHTGQAISHCP